MEKIIINPWGDLTQFDTETNIVIKNQQSRYSFSIKDFCRVRSNGQVITDDEVIDVKAGDVVLSASVYSKKEEKYKAKVLVISDPTIAYDVEQLINYVNEQSK